MTRNEAEAILLDTFGIPRFYDEQWMAIERILRGERILMIQRTGFGKSLCYQFPATLFPGITIIFSPLIALMRDQVNALNAKGINAAYINSEQAAEVNEEVIQRALDGKLKILYIAPERQENDRWIEASRRMDISMVVIDEAHTISTWGHDFRPAFRRIINLVRQLPSHLPILAATATATMRVQNDIEAQIGGKISTIRGSLVRPNFRLYVVKVNSQDEKLLWLAQNISMLPGTGLVYCGTRVEAESFAKWLQFIGVDAIEYHAGLDPASRMDIERGLMSNRWKCIVSTNALGMGLDKPDIRFVIHTQIPQSPIHYYQEIGRAGRDGLPTNIVLLFNQNVCNDHDGSEIFEDVRLPKAFIDNARPNLYKYLKVIELLKEEPLGERALVMRANLKSNQVRIIKADLINQGIVREVKFNNSKKLEYQFDAPRLNTDEFEALRKRRLDDLRKMVEYVFSTSPRMKFLCNFLDSNEADSWNNCDNTDLPSVETAEYDPTICDKLRSFKESIFPILETAPVSSKSSYDAQGNPVKILLSIPERNTITIYRNNELICRISDPVLLKSVDCFEKKDICALYKKHSTSKSRMLNGFAASYYGNSTVGATIHRCKYEGGGDFPDYLLTATLSAFYKNFRNLHFDYVFYVPPTRSGNLVRNFALKFASATKIPISHDLKKIRSTQEQKTFQNSYNKSENVAGAFKIENPSLIKNRHILLLDDIYDSGATLKEIGNLMTSCGAASITPLTIAKTVGGTI